MNQVFDNATEAMRVAHCLSYLLRRPVMRSITLNKHGMPLWVVSVSSASQNAL